MTVKKVSKAETFRLRAWMAANADAMDGVGFAEVGRRAVTVLGREVSGSTVAHIAGLVDDGLAERLRVRKAQRDDAVLDGLRAEVDALERRVEALERSLGMDTVTAAVRPLSLPLGGSRNG